MFIQYVASLDGQIVSALVRGEGIQFLSRVSLVWPSSNSHKKKWNGIYQMESYKERNL
jgi:hypothetical protein